LKYTPSSQKPDQYLWLMDLSGKCINDNVTEKRPRRLSTISKTYMFLWTWKPVGCVFIYLLEPMLVQGRVSSCCPSLGCCAANSHPSSSLYAASKPSKNIELTANSPVLVIRDPGSGAFWPLDPGSGSGMEKNPGSYFWEL